MEKVCLLFLLIWRKLIELWNLISIEKEKKRAVEKLRMALISASIESEVYDSLKKLSSIIFRFLINW